MNKRHSCFLFMGSLGIGCLGWLSPACSARRSWQGRVTKDWWGPCHLHRVQVQALGRHLPLWEWEERLFLTSFSIFCWKEPYATQWNIFQARCIFTINTYANLAKIHFRDKNVLILFISILLNVFPMPLLWSQAMFYFFLLCPDPWQWQFYIRAFWDFCFVLFWVRNLFLVIEIYVSINHKLAKDWHMSSGPGRSVSVSGGTFWVGIGPSRAPRTQSWGLPRCPGVRAFPFKGLEHSANS